MKYVLTSLLLLAGCAPTSIDELRCEGEAEIKNLTRELRRLESYEDVQQASKRLRRHFNRIADLLIETRKFSSEGGDTKDLLAAEELFAELARVYEIPGARSSIEAAQGEAVRRLDRTRSVPQK